MNIEEIKEREREATKGPWEFTTFSKPSGCPIETLADITKTISVSVERSPMIELWGVNITTDESGQYKVVCYTGNGPTSEANAAFIAHARQDIPDLLGLVDRQERKIEQLRDGLRRLELKLLEDGGCKVTLFLTEWFQFLTGSYGQVIDCKSYSIIQFLKQTGYTSTMKYQRRY